MASTTPSRPYGLCADSPPAYILSVQAWVSWTTKHDCGDQRLHRAGMSWSHITSYKARSASPCSDPHALFIHMPVPPPLHPRLSPSLCGRRHGPLGITVQDPMHFSSEGMKAKQEACKRSEQVVGVAASSSQEGLKAGRQPGTARHNSPPPHRPFSYYQWQ